MTSSKSYLGVKHSAQKLTGRQRFQNLVGGGLQTPGKSLKSSHDAAEKPLGQEAHGWHLTLGCPGCLPVFTMVILNDPSHTSEATEVSVRHHAPLQKSSPSPWELEVSARGRKLASPSSPQPHRTHGMQPVSTKQLGKDSWDGTAAW